MPETVCELIHKVLGSDYVCVDKVESRWYYFENHRWHQGDGSAIIPKIFENFVPEDEVTDNLRDELKELFYVKDFENLLDANPNTIGFNNGVFDVKAATFRAGVPGDYISYSVNYDYTDCSEEPLLERITSHHYMDLILTHIAEILDGPADGKINMWIPEKQEANSLDILVDVCWFLFGDYFAILSCAALTATEPMHDYFADKFHKRFVLTDISGIESDSQIERTRDVLVDACKRKATCKLFIIANSIPNIQTEDDDLWTRLQPFTWKFIDFIESSELRDAKEILMWLILNKYLPKVIKKRLDAEAASDNTNTNTNTNLISNNTYPYKNGIYENHFC